MIFKLVVLCACAAAAQALLAPAYGSPYGAYPAQPAVATQHQNILRSPWNLGQVTSFSKTVDTPYSSVSKSDVRVSNPGYAVGLGGLGVPAYHGGVGYGGLGVPAYHGGLGVPAYHGGVGYGAPALGLGYGHYGAALAAPVAKVAAPGLLGVAYSAAPAVSHMTYTNGLGLAYAW